MHNFLSGGYPKIHSIIKIEQVSQTTMAKLNLVVYFKLERSELINLVV